MTKVLRRELKMMGIPRLAAGSSSAEQVECCDDLITNILSRVSTRDALRMSTVSKRWKTLIFDSDFVHTHCNNRRRELIFWLTEFIEVTESLTLMPTQYALRCFNSQTGNVHISSEVFASSFQNRFLKLLTASNGLLCFHPSFPPRFTHDPLLWVYNPVRKVLKKVLMPFKVERNWMYFAQICYMRNTLKFVMAGFSNYQNRQYTLVFDSHSNSWYEGPPLLRSIVFPDYYFFCRRSHLFLNGVIYFTARVKSIDDQELGEIREGEAFRDEFGFSHIILGYDVKKDQWAFSIIIPSSVGSLYCLSEWKGNLLVCAANRNGYFVFWILDTEHKLWIRERELDLSHEFRSLWKVSASGGVAWFTIRGENSVKVYNMKNRHWSTYQLDVDFALQKEVASSFVTFEPTLLSF